MCGLVVDDENPHNNGSWLPWTHQPICSRSGKGNGEVYGDKYCVFTNAAFRRRHGFSFIGTPQAAISLRDAMADPPAHWDPRRRATYTPHVVEHDDVGPPYVVVEVPGKGKGVIATRRIPAGEVLMVDHPALIASMDFPRAISPERGRVMLQLAADQLPIRDEVFALAHGEEGGEGSERLIEDILRTNTFGLEIEGQSYIGLYTNISVSTATFQAKGPKLFRIYRRNMRARG